MRTIKFRAWIENEQKMIYDIVDIWERDGDGEYGDCFGEVIENGYPVMQFTGLKDKNKKEIYEGDIVKIDDTDEVINWVRGEIAVVEWKPAKFIIKCLNDEKNTLTEDFNDVLEVIGNKFENPELLESEK